MPKIGVSILRSHYYPQRIVAAGLHLLEETKPFDETSFAKTVLTDYLNIHV
jgi:hypothetical protein